MQIVAFLVIKFYYGRINAECCIRLLLLLFKNNQIVNDIISDLT